MFGGPAPDAARADVAGEEREHPGVLLLEVVRAVETVALVVLHQPLHLAAAGLEGVAEHLGLDDRHALVEAPVVLPGGYAVDGGALSIAPLLRAFAVAPPPPAVRPDCQ